MTIQPAVVSDSQDARTVLFRLSLYDTYKTVRLKRSLRPRLSKNTTRPQYLAAKSSRVRYTSKAGGASRDRTDDPLLAKQVLSQLSYGPNVRKAVGTVVPTYA